MGFVETSILGVEFIRPPLCMIPAGPFQMGDGKEPNSPIRTVEVESFQIGKYPLTVGEYAFAVKAGAVREPPQYLGVTWETQMQKPRNPVVCVSWFDVVDYTHWLSQLTSEQWRLPTEAEWEKSARGTDGRVYPWGNEYEIKRANADDFGYMSPSPIGSYPLGASPYGVQDMAGNVWAWCSTTYSPNGYTSNNEKPNVHPGNLVTVRGGSWNVGYWFTRSAYRFERAPDSTGADMGARLVMVNEPNLN